ncbi:MAG: hypothetical protein KGZ39_05605 [Simkania sp.]|nr:hypothetical protein [Simkania sp.]
MNYHRYIQSTAWQLKRLEYQLSKKPQHCLICHDEHYQLHHITYKNLGNEPLEDLMPLCDPHHLAVHNWLKAHRSPVERSGQALMALRDPKPRPTGRRLQIAL